MTRIKKIIFICVCVIVALRLISIAVFDNVDRNTQVLGREDISDMSWVECNNIEYNCYFSSDRLNSINLPVSGNADGVKGHLDVSISDGINPVYETKINFDKLEKNWWTSLFVNANVRTDTEYTISISTSKDADLVSQIGFVDGKPAIAFEYLQHSSRFDKLLYGIMYCILVGVVYLCLKKYEKIRDAVCGIGKYICGMQHYSEVCICVEIILTLIIIESTKIDFQNSTKIMLVIVAVLSTMNIKDKQQAASNVKNWVRYIVYAYVAFALSGHRLFIYPLEKHVNLVDVFVFACTYLWVIPVVDALIYLVEKYGKNILDYKDKPMQNIRFVFAALLFLIVPACVNLIANNPGISLQDTVTNMVENAHGIRGMLDWHPAFYAMILKIIFMVWDSTYAVLMVQYAFWIYVMLEFFLYLRKKKVNDVCILILAFISGITASNIILLNTILKDILYTYCLLWSIIIIANLTIDTDEYKGKWYIYIELVVALVGLYMLRKNGLVTYIAIVGSLLIVLKNNIRLWIGVIASIIIIGTIKGPVYNYFEIEPTGRFGMYIGLSQDILGVYYSGGNVSESTLSMINVMTEGDNAEYEYTPTWSFSSYYLDVKPTEFVLNYLDTFIKNPRIMTRAIICRLDGVWDIFDGQNSVLAGVNATATMDEYEEWRDYYPVRVYTALYEPMQLFMSYTVSNQLLYILNWRVGIAIIIGIVSYVYLVAVNGLKKYLILIAPHIGQFISLALSTGWSDFRYFWPYILMNMFLAVLAVVLVHKEKIE